VINTADTAATRAGNDISVRAAGPLAAVSNWIAGGDTSVLLRRLRTDARLRPYEFSIRQTIANARRNRTAAAPEVRSLNQRAATWGPELLQATNRQIDFGVVRDSSGRSYDVRQEPNAIRNNRERSVREAGFRANLRGVGLRADTFALILNNTASWLNEAARLQGLSDYAQVSYGQRFLSRESVQAMLGAIAAAAATNKRYEQLRRDRVKAELGVEQAHTWDLTAPRAVETPRYTIQEATAAIGAAVQPLGPSYVRAMSAVLSPQNGRIDLIARPNRVERPGFSTGLVGFPSMFFQGRFEGFTEDLVIMTHEAGHAVQNMLMDSAGVLTRYAQGPSYMTESYGLFSELLVLDYLARTSVYGKLLALAYYDEMTNNSAKFQRGYQTLLSRGYDAPPDVLLARSLGIEFTSEAFVPRATRVIENWIKQLEAEYARR
jgi:oligoendopeptidase F